jgi:hypothetical protein
VGVSIATTRVAVGVARTVKGVAVAAATTRAGIAVGGGVAVGASLPPKGEQAISSKTRARVHRDPTLAVLARIVDLL